MKSASASLRALALPAGSCSRSLNPFLSSFVAGSRRVVTARSQSFVGSKAKDIDHFPVATGLAQQVILQLSDHVTQLKERCVVAKRSPSRHLRRLADVPLCRLAGSGSAPLPSS